MHRCVFGILILLFLMVMFKEPILEGLENAEKIAQDVADACELRESLRKKKQSIYNVFHNCEFCHSRWHKIDCQDGMGLARH